MARVKCSVCGIRFPKHHFPPRCRQCVTGRTKTMGRPPGIEEQQPRRMGRPPGTPQPAICRKASIRGELTVLRARGRPRTDYDLPDAEIERRFAEALKQIKARPREEQIA
jgi:hypothetical protein